jgi:hypothetical protein
MDNVQKHNTCNNIPSSQTFKSYFQFLYGSLWKLTWTKLMSIKAEPSRPSTKWTVPVTSKHDRQIGVCLSVEWLRVLQTWTQLNSVCLFFVNTGEWVHFGISMVKEVYRQNGEKIRDNRKCSDLTQRRPEDVWSHGAGCEGSITGIAKKILQKTFAGNWHSLFHMSKNCQKSETAPMSFVHSPRIASNGSGEMCTILFMVPTFSLGTSRDFGHYMVYE